MAPRRKRRLMTAELTIHCERVEYRHDCAADVDFLRRWTMRALVSVLGAALVLAARAEATPVVARDLRAGDPVTGTFSYAISPIPPDRFADDPDFGWYDVVHPSARMTVDAGGQRFSSTPGALSVRVGDGTPSDSLHLFATRPGERGINFDLFFRFLSSEFSSDAFPTTIDPLALAPGPNAFLGSVTGGRSGRLEWSFGFVVDPISFLIMLNDGLLTGSYSGTLIFANGTPVANPVPEPASFLLMLSGLLALRSMRRSHLKSV
jgi:hypothetical protein